MRLKFLNSTSFDGCIRLLAFGCVKYLIIFVQLFGQEVHLRKRYDKSYNDAQQNTESKGQAANHQINTKESEGEASGHGEDELSHSNDLLIDALNCKTERESFSCEFYIEFT